MTTGERLRAILKRKYDGESQASIAEHLEIPPATLSEWLNEKFEPTLESIRELAARIPCKMSDLIGDESIPALKRKARSS